MKYGQPENHNEYQASEAFNKKWAETKHSHLMTPEQFRALVVSVIHSHNDVVKMADAIECGRSTVVRWATGVSQPHPIMFAWIAKEIRETFHEKL